MIGYEIDFYRQSNDYLDSDGPFFDDAEIDGMKTSISDFFKRDPQGLVIVKTGEYWGNEEDGFDFNAPLSEKEFNAESWDYFNGFPIGFQNLNQ